MKIAMIIIILVMTIILIIIIIIIKVIVIIIIILTIIFQNITEKSEKMTYFVFTILGMLLPSKMFYATHSKKGCYKILTDHK